MNILAFDTSLNKTYISLSKGEEVFSEIFESDDKNYHSAYLISGIKKITENNNVKLSSLDLIAVNSGPGSFTGIRVGVTVAKTMAKELNAKVLGVNSLDILYKTYEKFSPDVVLDARRNQFYFRNNDEISLVPYDEICLGKNTVVCDTSSIAHLNNSNANIINFEKDDVNLSLSLLEIAKNADLNDLFWYNLNPLYVQTPPIHSKSGT